MCSNYSAQMKCPNCEKKLVWISEHSYEDEEIEGDGIISHHTCVNKECDAETIIIHTTIN